MATDFSQLFHRLTSKVRKYNPNSNLALIEKAYKFALEKHGDSFRKSGDPFITHPLNVALKIADLGLDDTAIIAALLHDTVEDTSNATLTEIEDAFGDKVAFIVMSLTIFKDVAKPIKEEEVLVDRATNLILASIKDVRVLIIRLVDKVHNLETVEALSSEKQQKAARRVQKIYAPLADYIGLNYIKKQLDDLAFTVLDPQKFTYLKARLNQYYKQVDIDKLQVKLEKQLKLNNCPLLEIKARQKGVFSTYKKLQRLEEREIIDIGDPLALNRIYDKIGLATITDEVKSCYLALGIVHNLFKAIEGEFDDYIANPKSNGYRSLHTKVFVEDEGDYSKTCEIQIKTKEMDDYNEFGPASHLAYKLRQFNKEPIALQSVDMIKDLQKWKKQEDKMEGNPYYVDILSNRIFVFTKDADVIVLPKDATPVDFAYAVHTRVGNHCQGAKVNGKMTKIDTPLKTGDKVEIITSPRLMVSRDWLNFVKSSKARIELRRTLRKLGS